MSHTNIKLFTTFAIMMVSLFVLSACKKTSHDYVTAAVIQSLLNDTTLTGSFRLNMVDRKPFYVLIPSDAGIQKDQTLTFGRHSATTITYKGQADSKSILDLSDVKLEGNKITFAFTYDPERLKGTAIINAAPGQTPTVQSISFTPQ